LDLQQKSLTPSFFRNKVEQEMLLAFNPIPSTEMNQISHDFHDESIEAKVRWFRALPMSERMEIFCNYTDLALEINPDLAGKNDAQSSKGRIRILSKA
jgi:hypothetical protein